VAKIIIDRPCGVCIIESKMVRQIFCKACNKVLDNEKKVFLLLLGNNKVELICKECLEEYKKTKNLITTEDLLIQIGD
jgi:RNase P subunit RPR2